MKKFNFSLILFILFLLLSLVFSQDTVRVATYNLLNYEYPYEKDTYFRTVLDVIDADIVVVQEINGQGSVTNFNTNVLNHSKTEYTAGRFISGNADSDNALFYKDSLFTFITNQKISTSLRDINAFWLIHKSSNDTITVYSVHLKASSGDSDVQQRLNEVNVLRSKTDNLTASAKYMVVGDFNIYNSSEPAYQALLNTKNTGYFLDPIDMPGNWHNSSQFADIHTQSTRSGDIGDGGSSGGMDDRFDIILISQTLKDSGDVYYLPGSYHAFGNDGSHFNQSINSGGNSAVSQEVADALFYASDHLPVVCEFVFDAVTDLQVSDNNLIPEDFELKQNYPNPFNATTTIAFSVPRKSRLSLNIFDISGKKVRTLADKVYPAGEYRQRVETGSLASGIYYYQLKTEGFAQTRKFVLVK